MAVKITSIFFLQIFELVQSASNFATSRENIPNVKIPTKSNSFPAQRNANNRQGLSKRHRSMSSIPFVSFCLRTDMEESYETFEEELGPTRKDSLPQKPVRQFRQPGGDTRWQPLTHAICNGRTCDKIRLMLTTQLQAKLYIPIQATETWSLVRCATVIMCLSCPRELVGAWIVHVCRQK